MKFKQSWNYVIYILQIVAMLSYLSFAFAKTDSLTRGPLSEDGYMSLSVARHIGRGDGSTMNGLYITNGFQPLYVILIAPVFAIFQDDLITPLRFILVIGWLIQLASATLIGVISRDTLNRTDFPITSMVSLTFIVSLFMMNKFFNGLETGLVLLVYLILWRIYQTTGLKNLYHSMIFGLFLGLLILSRIDAGIFAVFFAISYFISKSRSQIRLHVIKKLFVISLIALVVSFPWWYYNYTNFDSIMPTSGKALSIGYANYDPHPLHEQWLGTKRVQFALDAISRNSMPFIYGSRIETKIPFVIIRWCIILLSVFLVIKFRKSIFRIYSTDLAIKDLNTSRNSIEFGVWLGLSMIFTITYYTYTIIAAWFYERYFSTISLISIIFMISPCIILLERTLRSLLYIGLVGLTIMSTGFIYLYHQGESATNSYRPVLQLVEHHVPSDELVASFESGYLSYYREGIVNLDGKTNSEIEQYYAEGDLLPYLEERKIRWVLSPYTAKMRFLNSDDWVEVGRAGTGAEWILYHQRSSTP